MKMDMDMDMDVDIDMTERRSTLLATIPENGEMQILRRSYRLGTALQPCDSGKNFHTSV